MFAKEEFVPSSRYILFTNPFYTEVKSAERGIKI